MRAPTGSLKPKYPRALFLSSLPPSTMYLFPRLLLLCLASCSSLLEYYVYKLYINVLLLWPTSPAGSGPSSFAARSSSLPPARSPSSVSYKTSSVVVLSCSTSSTTRGGRDRTTNDKSVPIFKHITFFAIGFNF